MQWRVNTEWKLVKRLVCGRYWSELPNLGSTYEPTWVGPPGLELQLYEWGLLITNPNLLSESLFNPKMPSEFTV